MEDELFIKAIIENLPVTFYYKDKDMKYRYISKLWPEMKDSVNDISDFIGKTDHELPIEKDVADFLYDIGTRIIEAKRGLRFFKEVPDINGDSKHYEVIAEPVIDENEDVTGIAVLMIDAGETIEQHKQLEKESKYDGMTNLYNRSYYSKHIAELENKPNAGMFIAMVDINHLKILNDIWGHPLGDEAIIATANALKSVFYKDCDIFRVGGDKFIVIGSNWSYKRLQKAADEANKIGRILFPSPVFPGISIGYSLLEDQISVSEALKKADINMYAMKETMKIQLNERLLKRLLGLMKKSGLTSDKRYDRMVTLSERLEGHHEIEKRDIDNINQLLQFQYIEKKYAIEFKKETPRHAKNTMDAIMRFFLSIMSNVPLNYYFVNINENWDGSGERFHRIGHEIPFYSQIIRFLTICDENRKLDADERKQYIRSLRGTILSPLLVDSLLDILVD